jgi:DUF4097 and DUF4098 domain-containing protein YvlB
MARLVIASLVVVLLVGCAGPFSGDHVTGSGKLVSQSFELADFSRIDADSVAQVEVTRGDEFSVEVEVDDNLASKLDVGVTDDTLRIKMQDGWYTNFTLRARVTMPELTGVTLDGASKLSGELASEDVALDLDGASRITLTGTAGRVTIKINGASQALLGDLTAEEAVEMDANGASRVEINANGAVSGKANGASRITVTGSPTSVEVETEGASQVITE